MSVSEVKRDHLALTCKLQQAYHCFHKETKNWRRRTRMYFRTDDRLGIRPRCRKMISCSFHASQMKHDRYTMDNERYEGHLAQVTAQKVIQLKNKIPVTQPLPPEKSRFRDKVLHRVINTVAQSDEGLGREKQHTTPTAEFSLITG